MKKSDITFHSDGCGRPGVAAVNVKVRFPYYDADARRLYIRVATDNGALEPEAREFAKFAAQEFAEDSSGSLLSFACESGWEHITDYARELWGPDAKVYSQGRSGGWAVPHVPHYNKYDGYTRGGFTRGCVESWDAVALGKFARFAKHARATADDIPYQMACGLYINEWESKLSDDEDDAREIESTRVASMVYDAPTGFGAEHSA